MKFARSISAVAAANGSGKLVVLAAFTKTDEGELVQAFEPR